jgi:GNAT superfamily N-acetyltransferase
VNRHVAELIVEVLPEARRRSIGTELVRRAVEIARAENRTSLAPWGPRDESSDAFWGRPELPEVSVDRSSSLVIADIDLDLPRRWRTAGTAKARGYRLRQWVSPVPGRIHGLVRRHAGRHERCTTRRSRHGTPRDGYGVEPRSRGEQRPREFVHPRDLCGVTGGDPAAMKGVILSRHTPWVVLQQGTTTLPAHRNLGLDRWLEWTMIDRLRAHHPRTVVIETGNADSNAAMRSINDEMGFRLHVEHTIRQADVETVEAAIERIDRGDPRRVDRRVGPPRRSRPIGSVSRAARADVG